MRNFLIGFMVALLLTGSVVSATDVSPVDVHIQQDSDHFDIYECWPAALNNTPVVVYLKYTESVAAYACVFSQRINVVPVLTEPPQGHAKTIPTTRAKQP